MTRARLAAVGLAILLVLGTAAAQTPAATPAPPPPVPAPLSVADIVLLLQMKVPHDRIEHFLDVAGVNFAVDARVGAQIIEAGGDKELLGAITLAKRVSRDTSAAPASVRPIQT